MKRSKQENAASEILAHARRNITLWLAEKAANIINAESFEDSYADRFQLAGLMQAAACLGMDVSQYEQFIKV